MFTFEIKKNKVNLEIDGLPVIISFNNPVASCTLERLIIQNKVRRPSQVSDLQFSLTPRVSTAGTVR